MAKSSGVNTKIAKKVHNNVNGHLKNLDGYIKTLKTDIEKFNKETWYGGKGANKWYDSMSTVFDRVVKFDNGVDQFQVKLKGVFDKDPTNIEF